MSGGALQSLIASAVQRNIEVAKNLLPLYPDIARAGGLMVDAFERGGRAFFIGSNGDAATARHLAGELLGGEHPPLAAAAPSDHPGRHLRGHARAGDLAVAISARARPPDVVAAARVARELDLRVVSLCGEDAEALAPHSDVVLAIPARGVARVQEAHLLVGHILCEWVVEAMFGQKGA